MNLRRIAFWLGAVGLVGQLLTGQAAVNPLTTALLAVLLVPYLIQQFRAGQTETTDAAGE